MATNSLHNIIAVENELQGLEDEEKARAAQWLAEQKAALQAEFASRRDELTREMEAALQQAGKSAERKAAETLNAAEGSARRLAGAGDETLRQILTRHLLEMVTGRLS